jgi:hypothetical protein
MSGRFKVFTHKLLHRDGTPNEQAVEQLREMAEKWRIQLVSRSGMRDAEETARRLGVYEICDWRW